MSWKSRCAVLAVALLGLASTVRADDVVGSITRVQGNNLTVKLDDGGTVQVRVTSGTTVEFTDSGDKRAWPNPGVSDLRVGMGVKIPDGQSTVDHVRVHFVPEGMHRGSVADSSTEAGPTPGSGETLKVRIQSLDTRRGQMSADVAGRTRVFFLEPGVARDVRTGDLVVVTVGNNGRVSRIDPSEMRGVVRSVNERARTFDVSVNGRTQTYPVANEKDLRDIRPGDTVSFELEDRGSRPVAVRISRD